MALIDMRISPYFLACLLVPLAGCEKLAKQFAKPNLELQEQCAKQARLEFTSDGFGTERTLRCSFTDHYNPALNRCFIEEYAANPSFDLPNRYSSIFVSDVYEHRQYASFAMPLKKGEKPGICEVTMLSGAKVACKSEEEFNELVKQYME